jgi:hypothetical protein
METKPVDEIVKEAMKQKKEPTNVASSRYAGNSTLKSARHTALNSSTPDLIPNV